MKTLSVKVAHKEFACVHPNLPHTHSDGWKSLMKLLESDVAEGYIPTSLISNTSAGGSCYILAVTMAKPNDAKHREHLTREALALGWESSDNGKSFCIGDVKNYLLNLSKGKYAYAVKDIVSSFKAKGINCTEEGVLELVKNLNIRTYYDKRTLYVPASVNSECMQPMPRMVEEVIFVRPLC